MALIHFIALVGCTSIPSGPPPAGKPAYTYTIGPGDVLSVEVFDEPKLKQEAATVTPDGKITFPLVGTVEVGDRTLSEAADIVTSRLVKNKGFADPEAAKVAVTLRESRSAQIHVVGEVAGQRSIPYHGRLSLVQAISQSGGLHWATAKTEAVHIVRGALDSPEVLDVDLDDVFAGAIRDPFLAPGDIVVVPPKYVTRFDRYVQQVLSPIRSLVGAGREGASTAATGL